MKQTIVNAQIGLKIIWISVVSMATVAFYGFIASSNASAQANTQAVDSMYKCIDVNSKKAKAKSNTDRGDKEFRSTLRNKTLKGVKDRKKHLSSEKFSDARLQREQQRLDKLITAGNKSLKNTKVVRPKFHFENIKTERANLLAQLDDKAKVARDPNSTTDQLITNYCETSWGLRAYAVAGRKWQAQINNDTLSARNAIVKALWIAADKPANRDPSQYDKQISEFQNKLDAVVFARTGIVGVSTLNPKNGDSKSAFQEHMYTPQKHLREGIVADSQQLKKSMAPKVIKPTKKNKHGYVQLPTNNEFYYIYGSRKANTGNGGSTPSYQRYGKPTLVKVFQDVAIQFHKKYPETKLVAGDLNAIDGHGSHKNGIDMDVYSQNYMATDMRGKHKNSKSVERSVALGKMFLDTKKIDVIFYNDPVVARKVNAYAQKNKLPGRMTPDNSSHEYHFHVRIKAKPGPSDSCAKAGAAKNCFR